MTSDPDFAKLTRAINDLARIAGHLKEELKKMNGNLAVIGTLMVVNQKEEEQNEPT